jgi:hypothetical protein
MILADGISRLCDDLGVEPTDIVLVRGCCFVYMSMLFLRGWCRFGSEVQPSRVLQQPQLLQQSQLGTSLQPQCFCVLT